MGYIIDDKNFINDNIFKFEKRLESQYSIFLDRTPTFVTYYHINNINSTTDNGWQNIDKVLGPESPLRYQEIKDFPIYGIENIKLDLSDNDEGLTTDYDGEGVILPNTIKPVPNDFFIISYLDQNFLFMVNAVNYDTIKSNNFYSISFHIRSLSGLDVESLRGQVLEKYTCIFKNIGTDDKFLIKDDEYDKFIQLNNLYTKLVQRYLTIFYVKKLNTILFDNANNEFIYDKYLSHFIMENMLFAEKDSYNTIMLTNEDNNERFIIEYDDSIYSILESGDKSLLPNHLGYWVTMLSDSDSIFKYYTIGNVKSVHLLPSGKGEYLSDDLIAKIHTNDHESTDNIIDELIVRYFNKTIKSMNDLKLHELEKYKIRYTYENFTKIPILLFILRFYSKQFMAV